ncbi:hypothetical protein LTR92_011549 [Exophiala xenobiotica]|nr:hypothetical protein LTR92_011549 [Exophiala xenobiotica]KAK5309507.1 hypothetical protein LTR93_012212 [Exophiala xenobiotica]
MDLFPLTRARLLNASQHLPDPIKNHPSSSADSEALILKTVFHWEGDIGSLIRDELRGHPVGSLESTLLDQWLQGPTTEVLAESAHDLSRREGVSLGRDGIGNEGQTLHHLTKGSLTERYVHTAATRALVIRRGYDGIRLYQFSGMHMEALLMTIFVFPNDGHQQCNELYRWAVWLLASDPLAQQGLILRCFYCVASGGVHQASFPSHSDVGLSDRIRGIVDGSWSPSSADSHKYKPREGSRGLLALEGSDLVQSRELLVENGRRTTTHNKVAIPELKGQHDRATDLSQKLSCAKAFEKVERVENVAKARNEDTKPCRGRSVTRQEGHKMSDRSSRHAIAGTEFVEFNLAGAKHSKSQCHTYGQGECEQRGILVTFHSPPTFSMWDGRTTSAKTPWQDEESDGSAKVPYSKESAGMTHNTKTSHSKRQAPGKQVSAKLPNT